MTNTNTTATVPGIFDPKTIEDSNNPYPRPLSLVTLPLLPCQCDTTTINGNIDNTNDGHDVLAYGGDDGAVYLLPSSRGNDTSNNNTSDGSSTNTNNANNSNNSNKPIRIREYDDEVKSIAVSSNGLRVAIGFDDGSTKIYSYDDYQDGAGDPVQVHHPFIPTSNANDNDEDAGFMTQGDDDNGILEFDGPRMDAPIRQLAFDPRGGSSSSSSSTSTSTASVPYYLAIASESGNQPLCIVNATDNTTAVDTVYLDEKSMEEYESSGLRSVAYSYSTINTTTGGKSHVVNGNNVLLATLGMDGKLATWDVTSTSDPSLLWDVISHDVAPCAKQEGFVADAGDKASHVVWDTCNDNDKKNNEAILFLPGQSQVQYRVCPLSKQSKNGEDHEALSLVVLSTEECKKYLRGPAKFVTDENGGGHKDVIVAMAVPPKGSGSVGANSVGNKQQLLVTGGRDGRVLLWNLTRGDENEFTGSATEVELGSIRQGDTLGIPPITSILWEDGDTLSVGFADGTVASVAVDVDALDGEKESEMDDVDVDVSEDEMSHEEESSSSKKEKSKKLSKAAANDEETDDENMFNEDVPAVTANTPPKKSNDEDPETDDDEMFNEDVPSPPKKGTAEAATPAKADAVSNKASKFIDDEADDGDDNADIQYDDVTPVKPTETNDTETAKSPAKDNATDNDNVDDDMNMFESHNDALDFTGANDTSTNYFSAAKAPQEPFAVSSTPLDEPRRILCWNHVGVATIREAEDNPESRNLVDITFHDSSGLSGGRRPQTVSDNSDFIVGALGEDGAMFASDMPEEEVAQDDDDDDLETPRFLSAATRRAVKQGKQSKKGEKKKGSSIQFNRYETFGRVNEKQWNVDLPEGERVLGCATGSGWAAAITNRRFLRLFAVSGVQGPIIWIPGEPVTVVGRDRFVAVFYHRSSPAHDGTQMLGYTILDGVTGVTLTAGEVSALSAGSDLKWAGFNEHCALSIMDSDGMLSMLARNPTKNSPSVVSTAANWMPMLDTVAHHKDKLDLFWPVEVHAGKLVCVPLRGGKEYPDAGRRPVTTTLQVKMPMASNKTVAQEDMIVRATFALNQERVFDEYLLSQGEINEDELEETYEKQCLKLDKYTLKFFTGVVKSGKVERGLDIARRLHSEKSFDVAIHMADRMGHRKLSDRVEQVKCQRFPPMDEEDEGFDDDAASYDSGARSEGSNVSFEEEPVIATRQQRMEMISQRVSPGDGAYTPRQQGRRDDIEVDDGGYSTGEESPPRESLKRKFEADNIDTAPVTKKRMNPFVKKKLESPAKGIMKIASPQKLSLSRASTFSAKSRMKERSGKKIL